MSYKWPCENAGGSIGGILRKGGTSYSSLAATTIGEVKSVDLLVFGYACKVFRDDEKARDIDQGKHLIPWMADSNLKIDRYDVRGALCDLSPHEAPPGGYGNRLEYLTLEEQRAEQLCEEERYLYLYRNEEEQTLYQEEELKRLQQDSNTYRQVGFQYNDSSGCSDGAQHGPNREENSNSPTDETDQAFELPANFEVPPYIQLPETMKEHTIIEKTARFISTQGAQMEILIKAKQSNNVQFEFLTQNSVLHTYYKFVLNALKNGTYTKEVPDNLTESIDDSSTTTTQLRCAAVSAKRTIKVPTIKYKPSASCAYTQLISKIKGVPLPSDTFNKSESIGSPKPAETTNQQVENENFTPVLLQYTSGTYYSAASTHRFNAENSSIPDIMDKENLKSSLSDDKSCAEVLKSSNALMMAQCYSSETDSDDEAAKMNFPMPPDALKNIIDKTAGYVIKNGRQFEETLRTKSDERFTFLFSGNEYYSYYMFKITGDPEAAWKEKRVKGNRKHNGSPAVHKVENGGEAENKRDKVVAPVCFSIKTKEDTPSTRLALSQDGTDDEEEQKIQPSEYYLSHKQQQTHSRTVPEHVQKAIKLVESQLMARNAHIQLRKNEAMSGSSFSNISIHSARSRFDVDNTGSPKTKMSHSSLTTQLSSAKSNSFQATTQSHHQQYQQKVLKRAEDKVKDKLAQIAREKLGGLISKEKQLQLERKCKALAFLNHIKGTSLSVQTSTTEIPTEVNMINSQDPKSIIETDDATDSDNLSVHSIPISSYGGDDKTDDEVLIFTAPSMAPTSSKLIEKNNEKNDYDDDVQIITESTKIQKLKSKEKLKLHRRTRTLKTADICKKERSISNSPNESVESPIESRYRSYKSKKNSSKSRSGSSHSHRLSHRKKKTKKRLKSCNNRHTRSRSRSPSQSYRPRPADLAYSPNRRQLSSLPIKTKKRKHND